MTSDVLGLAGRYADALLELAEESSAAESVEADVKQLQTMIAESDDFRRFIGSPIYSREEQIQGVSAIAEKAGMNDVTRKFLMLVASNRRLFALSAILATILDKLAERRGEVTASVTSARELTAAQQGSLKDGLKKALGRDISLHCAVDPKVLGGLVVQVGSRMVDSSLRSQLQRLQLAMKGVG